jgi:Uma2 family endonuclease
MATQPIYEDPQAELISVREYLTSSYRPDCDYVEGRIEERNLGEYDHGFLQAIIAALFTNNRASWQVRTVTEVRTQVKSARFRVPDVSVLRADAPREPIIRHPQLIAIEILSPEDRLSKLQEKVDDYLDFGVENIWVIDPETRKAWTADSTGFHIVQNGELIVPGTPIRVVLGELFAEMDRA